MAKKIFTFLGGTLLLILVGLATLYLLFDETLPTATTDGPTPDALVEQLYAAVDKPGWDTTRYVTWDFAGRHRFLWHKTVDSVRVVWDNVVVDLHTKTLTGTVREGGQLITGARADELLADAWSHFANDSFWLAAPYKVEDPGTERATVRLDDGGYGLLVTYNSGGVTPGDSYLWEFGEDGLPRRWRMWTQIIPVGGVAATWEGYTTLPTGARLATRHELPVFTLELEDVAGGMTRPSF